MGLKRRLDVAARRPRTCAFAAGLGLLAVATVHAQPGQTPAKAPESAPAVQGEPAPKPLAPPAGVAAPARVQGPVYTWEDGDRTMRARLQPDLVVREDGAVGERETYVARAGDRTIVRSGSRAAEGGQPVFRSESGRLMTLPGGVVLILDPDWTEPDLSAFFAANGVGMDRVSRWPAFRAPGSWRRRRASLPSISRTRWPGRTGSRSRARTGGGKPFPGEPAAAALPAPGR